MYKIHFRKNKSGFTIVELVAVIIVLAVCLAPFGVMFSHVMEKHAEPEAQQVATALAQSEIERASNLRFSNIANEGPTIFPNFPNYSYQVIVTPIAGQHDMDEYKQIEVRVTNSSLGVTVSLITIATIKENVS